MARGSAGALPHRGSPAGAATGGDALAHEGRLKGRADAGDDQARVVRQDAELAIDAGHDDHVHLVGERPSLGGDDLQLKRHLPLPREGGGGGMTRKAAEASRDTALAVAQPAKPGPGSAHARHSRHPSFSALAMTSSILPAMKNACSGSWSCLPSRISPNPRTVSFSS